MQTTSIVWGNHASWSWWSINKIDGEFPEIGKRGNEKICGEVGAKVELRDIELLEDPFVKVNEAELHPAPFERSQKLSVPVQFWYTDHLMQKQK